MLLLRPVTVGKEAAPSASSRQHHQQQQYEQLERRQGDTSLCMPIAAVLETETEGEKKEKKEPKQTEKKEKRAVLQSVPVQKMALEFLGRVPTKNMVCPCNSGSGTCYHDCCRVVFEAAVGSAVTTTGSAVVSPPTPSVSIATANNQIETKVTAAMGTRTNLPSRRSVKLQ